MMGRLSHFLFLIFLANPAFVGFAQDTGGGEAVEKLRSQFSRELGILDGPLEKLNGHYRQYLEKQKGAYQQKGDLKAMLAVDGELKSFAASPSETLSTFPELKRLQGIYREQRANHQAKANETKLKLIRSFADTASGLAKEFTKAGKIDEAKLALAEAERFAELEKDPSLAVVVKPAADSNSPKGGGTFEGSQAGEEMENGLGMKLCWIPPGKFTMGSPEGEKGRRAEYEAQAEVELTRGFWIGKYEVTQGEYEEVMGTKPAQNHGAGIKGPVENVTWEKAMDFCEKLTDLERKKGKLAEGWIYTLPTGAQWEYACRAGEKGPYSGGEIEEVGWFKENADGKTYSVGEKKPNPWGMHDMHGNVREWCRDWFTQKLSGGQDPEGPDTGRSKVSRGGSYSDGAAGCRSANRVPGGPTTRGGTLGLRPVLVPFHTDR